MFSRSPRPRYPRRGVTLVEMLVSVALLVLMMTVIVQVFAAATGSVSSSRTFQELDQTLRQLDGMIRGDLSHLTAPLTPPLDPDLNQGYFEYGENSFADLQGEDTDDYVRFTVKAPQGQFFTGRFYATPMVASMSAAQLNAYLNTQPITITSQTAEVIYFLRNGNLYRRVLLVAPDRETAAHLTIHNLGGLAPNGQLSSGTFQTAAGPADVSWQGLNDLSARPISTGDASTSGTYRFVLNTLGDLTNRENRFAYSRWANDYINETTGASTPDGVPDDENRDTVHDFVPSLYQALFSPPAYPAGTIHAQVNEPQTWGQSAYGSNPRISLVSSQMMAFPYTFPGAYSKPDPYSATNGYGWIHTPDPSLDQTILADLQRLNHNPIDLGDSLPIPPAGTKPTYGGHQTWWGFPTWRETMARSSTAGWSDPFWPINLSAMGSLSGQPPGLIPPSDFSAYPPAFASNNVLPPMDASYIPTGLPTVPAGPFPFRANPQFMAEPYSPTGPNFSGGSTQFVSSVWPQVWEDDLIATGVRSFDIKAYDNAYLNYADLGWGDDLRILNPITGATTPPLLAGYSASVPAFPLSLTWNGGNYSLIHDSVAHEGRIPPLVADYRLDPQMLALNGGTEWSAAANNSYNIGDNSPSINRLRRVWDTWSTDYSHAPATAVDPTNGQPYGPPFGPPVYPSFPAPYPMPLRGIQIQIRVVDPRSEKVKTLTIRHGFN